MLLIDHVELHLPGLRLTGRDVTQEILDDVLALVAGLRDSHWLAVRGLRLVRLLLRLRTVASRTALLSRPFLLIWLCDRVSLLRIPLCQMDLAFALVVGLLFLLHKGLEVDAIAGGKKGGETPGRHGASRLRRKL